MYLKCIELIDFQGHEHSKFLLDSNFTCIIGDNNQGKSSVIRALQFVYFDLWDKEFVRHGAEAAKVIVERDDGVSITRIKGETVNDVIVKNRDKVIAKYSNFGKGLPEELKENFYIKPVKLDVKKEENINIASQFDQPFLLFESGPTKLKILNRVTGAHTVDVAQRELNKDKKRLMSKSRELEELVIENEAKLKEYENLNELENQLNKAIKAYECVEKYMKKEDKLVTLKLELQRWQNKYKEYQNKKKKLDAVDMEAIEQIKYLAKRLENLKNLAEKLSSLSEGLDKTEKEMSKLKEAYIDVRKKVKEVLLKEKICPTCFRPLDMEEVDKIIKKRYTV